MNPGSQALRSILLINPNTSVRTAEMMVAAARPLLPPGIAIRGTSAAHGAPMIVDEAALRFAAAEVVRIGLSAAADAIVVAAFGDPGARRLRERLTVPVVGIGEAAITEAAAGGRRFGIATTTTGLVAAIEALVRQLALDGCFTGVRVTEADPLALVADPAGQEAALAAAAERCIGLDGAGAVVIGGGPLSATAARLRQRLGAAIIEPVPAAIRALLAHWEGGAGLRRPGDPV